MMSPRVSCNPRAVGRLPDGTRLSNAGASFKPTRENPRELFSFRSCPARRRNSGCRPETETPPERQTLLILSTSSVTLSWCSLDGAMAWRRRKRRQTRRKRASLRASPAWEPLCRETRRRAGTAHLCLCAGETLAVPPPPSTLLDLLLSRAGSVWGISKWRMAHRRGYHISQYTQDPAYKEIIMKHELDYRTSIPLPLVCAIEREVLQILQNTATDYASQLGSQHSLTQEVKQRIDDLSVRVSCKTEDDLFLPQASGWRRALATLWALPGVWRQK